MALTSYFESSRREIAINTIKQEVNMQNRGARWLVRLFFLGVLLLGNLSVCIGSTNWPNEPVGATQLTDFNFDSRCSDGWRCVYPSGKIVQDATAPLSGPNVLQYSWVNHNFTDVSNSYYTFPAGTREFYIGLWWKPSNPFYGWPTVQQQKLLLLEGSHTYFSMYRKSGSGASSSYGIWNHIDGSNNNQHIGSGFGQGELLFPNMSGTTVALGQWHRLEWYVKASTTPTAQNGVFRWWMDGQLLGNYTNVNTKVPTFETITLTSVWDAVVPEYSSYTDSHRYDHVHISLPSGVQLDPLFISTGSLPSAQSGKPYAAYLKAEGGKAPYSWTISAGNLLLGLTLNKATGAITGVPATGGKCEFTIKVLDASMPPIEFTKQFSIVASGTSSIQTGKQLAVSGSRLTAEARADRVLFRPLQVGAYLLNVYDLSGREVWSHAGVGQAIWNHGGKLKKGVYLARVEQGGKTMSTTYCHVR